MDVVYLVRRGDRNDELRMSLRSLVNVPHDRVWFVGDRPRWATGVEFIKGNRSAQKAVNVFHNVRAACEHSDVSDRFVMMNDDFYCLAPVDLRPLYRCSLHDHLESVKKRRDQWARSLRFTHTWLTEQGIERPRSYELHMPLLVDKAKMADVLARVGTYGHPSPPQWRTVYGNLHTRRATQVEDCKVRAWCDVDEVMARPIVSSSDATFPRIRPALEALFPDPSPYETVPVLAGR